MVVIKSYMSPPTSLTPALKAALWSRFGTVSYPAEWDGVVHGGGKISQRFWEYFKTIELLDLDENSVVLDIGGGSPETGLGFFAGVLATRVKKLLIMDPCVDPAKQTSDRQTGARIELIPNNANYEELSEVLKKNPDVTHLSCVSVFEHIEPSTREGIIRAINDHFQGSCFVTTFEYHTKAMFFPHQLTASTASDLVKPLTRFYLDRYESSPVIAGNAFDEDPQFRLRQRRFFWQKPRFSPSYVPKWYPVALRFVEVSPNPRPEDSQPERNAIR